MNVNEAPSNLPTGRGFSRRTLLGALAATPALAALLAACGSDAQTADSTADTTADSTGNTAGGTGIERPTGKDDVVLRFGYVGGFVPQGFAFMNAPSLLVSGDGRVIQGGVVPAIYPGPLLPALNERSITEAGIQRLLDLAETAHLLQTPPDYSAEIMVADAADTQVIINAKDQNFLHQAAALGFDTPEKTDARQALAKFVELISDLATVVGAENLGAEIPFAPESYRLQARAVTEEELTGFDVEPTRVPWPADAGVALADAAECAIASADVVGALLTEANQLTYFTEGDAIYQVSAIALLPGDTC
jgi:hypothetical protein